MTTQRRTPLKRFGIFALAFVMGTLYAGLVGLVSSSLRGPLISWLIWIGLFWFVFSKFNLFRFIGFIAVLPVSVLAFEFFWSRAHPVANAEVYKTFDRSHYTPGLRVGYSGNKTRDPASSGWGLTEILIGRDGFRADPDTGEGNPERCQWVLIGDSMIYGSGLPYAYTLRPVLASLGVRACVFGVTGNSPVDYLATLKFVADRIDPGAQIAFYLYAYNDFVSFDQYLMRRSLSLSHRFRGLFEWAFHFDRWRQGTFTYAFFNGERTRVQGQPWRYPVASQATIKIFYPHNPAEYRHPKPFSGRQRQALEIFFNSLNDFARGRAWRVYVLIHPDDAEIYANFARQYSVLVDLDERRAEGLKLCKQYPFVCEDISRYLYEKSVAAGKNPYFNNNRHFSVFGTRLVAEHFAALTKRAD